eukprot:CAMPEP_0194315144 /NCGR_PEP_ID=MMETSP0171-20130528/11955_1 /TAXON_ID=218684 /ORGANISM="Corethron pennatum, Strain L29A3" /LENGTH=117 /DNA_ID=CAMNT_0039070835 /DNA_START=60 /DNA_END=410 /DNA_ORIENTATION=-
MAVNNGNGGNVVYLTRSMLNSAINTNNESSSTGSSNGLRDLFCGCLDNDEDDPVVSANTGVNPVTYATRNVSDMIGNDQVISANTGVNPVTYAAGNASGMKGNYPNNMIGNDQVISA